MKQNTAILTIFYLCLFLSGELKASDSYKDSAEIIRIIDASKDIRPFPDLVAYRNTSLQKAPAPILGEISEDVYGRAKITRCWLNLDEMWDYQTRQFNFNFKIGVDKYKDIVEKHRETWDWQVESPVTFYTYLKTFSDHSDAVMLTIRRYERDILDGKLPVTMADYKMIFKEGLKHYKMLFPNIRYVEVGNEYAQGFFMVATAEEYYRFYKLGSEAVSEVNEELGLKGNNRILVGGPVAVSAARKKIDKFFKFFNNDENKEKSLDFISWHSYNSIFETAYSKHTDETAYWENEIRALLLAHDLPENLPLFMTEHNAFHFSEDSLEYHFINAAYLPKSLYYNNVNSPGVKIFPWVLYHNSELQTRFIWFDGPNEPGTKACEIRMLPIGASMKMLSMHKGREIEVDNSINDDNLVLASVQKDKIIIQAINYGSQRNVKLSVMNINKIFPELKNGHLKVVKYLIDSSHSNCLTNPEYLGGIEKIEDFNTIINNGEITLKHNKLEKNGILLWELIQDE